MREILTVNVKITSTVTVKGHSRSVSMVNFSGRCEGGYFNGEILPGAVDTQVFGGDGNTLSARYALEGIDYTGERCRLFIENNSEPNSDCTAPKITTDSAALSRLETAKLAGKIEPAGDGCIVIHIYEKS